MNSFWSGYIIILVIINIVGYAAMLFYMRKMPKNDVPPGERRHHTFDGIEEFNHPLPRWWMWLFFICIIFSVIYLFLYPGLGSYQGYYGWSQQNQWLQQQKEANQKYGAAFAQYKDVPIEELGKNPEAMQTAQRLFLNTCAVCHGTNAKGAKGFPNLTTNVWLFGGRPEDLVATITHGRMGVMPPMGAAIGGETEIPKVAHYVLKISGQKYDETLASAGEVKFKAVCAACHGVDGTGNKAIGAPNLTAGKWIFGGSLEDIEDTIRHGRQAQMPAHEKLLSADKIHLLAAYVYYLANQQAQPEDKKQ